MMIQDKFPISNLFSNRNTAKIITKSCKSCLLNWKIFPNLTKTKPTNSDYFKRRRRKKMGTSKSEIKSNSSMIWTRIVIYFKNMKRAKIKM